MSIITIFFLAKHYHLSSIFTPSLQNHKPLKFNSFPPIFQNPSLNSHEIFSPRQHYCKSSNFFSLNPQFHSLFSSFMSLSSMDRRCKPAGEIHVIVGPMFAGKTTALLRRIKSESNSGRFIILGFLITCFDFIFPCLSSIGEILCM